MKSKITTALLAALMLAGTLTQVVSCGSADNAGTSQTTTANTASAETEAVTEDTRYQANLPADLNYNGEAFNIVTYDDSNATWYDVDFAATEETGDTLNDAAFRRMIAVEQLLNIDIVACPSEDYGTTLVKKSVMAGDGAYDCGFVKTHGATSLAESGMLVDLKTMETLDIAAPWWDQNAVNDLTIGERLFMVTGDISIMYKKSIGVLLFNKQMLNDQDLEDPYQLVKDMKWTIDKFNEMASTVSQDVNGDGKYDLEDKYGLLYYCDMIALGLIGGGTHFTTKNAEDYPTLTFYTDRTTDIFNKYTELMYNPQLSISWSKLEIGRAHV